jgi:TPR repeat protein
MYADGTGPARDETQAMTWFRKAAAQGNRNAEAGIRMLETRIREVQEAQTAADRGNAIAQATLAWKYYSGEGVVQDYAIALMWFRKAADQGNATGQYGLGFMYEHGDGVKQDYAQAATWYRKAAKQGDRDAQYQLEEMVRRGRIPRQRIERQ